MNIFSGVGEEKKESENETIFFFTPFEVKLATFITVVSPLLVLNEEERLELTGASPATLKRKMNLSSYTRIRK